MMPRTGGFCTSARRSVSEAATNNGFSSSVIKTSNRFPQETLARDFQYRDRNFERNGLLSLALSSTGGEGSDQQSCNKTSFPCSRSAMSAHGQINPQQAILVLGRDARRLHLDRQPHFALE